jgi:hypothetical protein
MSAAGQIRFYEYFTPEANRIQIPETCSTSFVLIRVSPRYSAERGRYGAQASHSIPFSIRPTPPEVAVMPFSHGFS